jgi:hypothetical protein
MQKTNLFKSSVLVASVLACLASSAFAQTVVTGSVETVDALIKRENDELRNKNRPQPVGGPGMGAVIVAPPPVIRVESIYGLPGNLRADFSVDGALYEGITRGGRVGQCRVMEVVNKCVKLAPAQKGRTSCSEVCWTGDSPPPPAMDMQAGSHMGSGSAMPSPLPMGSAGGTQRAAVVPRQ